MPERPKGDKSEAPQLSRLAQMRKDKKDDQWQPEMPHIEAGGHLLAYLFEVGPVMAGAAGPTRLTEQEVAAWQANAGVRLLPWEAKFLRLLSGEYLAESQRAERQDCPSPLAETDAPDLRAVAQDLRSRVKQMAKL